MEWIKITDDIHPLIEQEVIIFFKTSSGIKVKELAYINSITEYKDRKDLNWTCKDWGFIEPTHFCYLPEDPE